MSLNYQVFVLQYEARDIGTANDGSILVPPMMDQFLFSLMRLTYTYQFSLRLTTFNTVFSAPNVSPSRGNTIQMDDGTNIVAVVLDTESYSIGASNDIGNAVASALTKASGRVTLTATFNNATNHYTFAGSNPFKFIFPAGNNLAKLLGFNPAINQVINTAQVATKLPIFYNDFLVQITAGNSVTQLVNVPRGKTGTLR